MKTPIKLLAFLFLVTFSFSCNKSNEEVEEEIQTELETNVYAVVSEYDGTNFTINVWKNDVVTPLSLSNATSVRSSSIYVSGTDVYVGGSEYNGSKHIAKIWKNGTSTSLSDGSISTFINSIFVAGSDVYAAGKEQNGSAIIWKNGIATSLSDHVSNVFSIFVNESDVYAVGYEEINDKQMATLWKNGVATAFDEAEKFISFNAVYVSNNTVYIAGEEYIPGLSIEPDLNFATIWVDGIKTRLDCNYLPTPTSIFVLDDDIYVTGSEYIQGSEKTKARLWKNGEGTDLTDGLNRAQGQSVFASGTDVYVGGYASNGTKNVAVIWKNGVPTTLTDGANNASVNSVFVTTN
tara:strand:+ start:52651 stop:53697 length:1047 start_codon:yes stop_codon:yes gene_type:complete